jgi:hypothetical protein
MLWKQQDPSVPLGGAPVTGGCQPFFKSLAAAVALAVVFTTPLARAQRPDIGDWIATWTASPQPIWDAEFPVPLNIPRALRNQTVRQIAAISIGDNRVRVSPEGNFAGDADMKVDSTMKARVFLSGIRGDGDFMGTAVWRHLHRRSNGPGQRSGRRHAFGLPSIHHPPLHRGGGGFAFLPRLRSLNLLVRTLAGHTHWLPVWTKPLHQVCGSGVVSPSLSFGM